MNVSDYLKFVLEHDKVCAGFIKKKVKIVRYHSHKTTEICGLQATVPIKSFTST